jgi:phage tail-like protein
MSTGDRPTDPYRSYNFRVKLGNITRAGFRECSGLDSSQDPIDYREGNQSNTTRKLPGLVKHSNIILKRGITDDVELWKWRQAVIDRDDKNMRQNGSIELIDDYGNVLMQWDFIDAWPSKWTGPTFNATGNEVAIETLEIVHEGLKKA